MDSVEVQDEIGVILAEKTSRESENVLAMRQVWELLYADTRFANETIGTEKTIRGATSEALAAFYHEWYHPERMILVVAGDVAPADVIPLIEQGFADMQADGPAPVVPSWGQPRIADELLLYQPRPISNTVVRLSVLHERAHYPDSRSLQEHSLNAALANYCLMQRLKERGEQEPALWSNARSFFDLYTSILPPSATLFAVTGADTWRQALAALDEEMRRAVEHGFSEQEVERAVLFYRQSLERAVRNYESMPSEDLADAFVATANADRVYTSPEYDLELFEEFAGRVTPAGVHAEFSAAFGPEQHFISVSGNARLENGEDDIRAAWAEIHQRPVQAYGTGEAAVFPYLELPADTGLVPSLRERRAAPEAPTIYEARLPNGVELYLLPTTFEKDQVSVSLLFGSGTRALADEQFPLMRLSSTVMRLSGLGRLNSVDTERLFAGRGLSVGEGYYPQASEISGSSTTDDLATLLLAVWTQYKDPTPQASAREKAVQSLIFQEQQRFSTVDGVDMADGRNYFFGRSLRFSALEATQAKEISLEDIVAFVAASRQGGPLRLIVSGDFDPKLAAAHIARLFGGEPAVGSKLPARNRAPEFPAAAEQRIDVPDEVDKAVSRLAWRCDFVDERDRELLTTRRMLASIVSDRLRQEVREHLGVAYGPGAYYRYLMDDGGFGLFIVDVASSREHVAAVTSAVERVVAELLKNGVAGEELNRLKLPNLTAWRTSLRETDTLHNLLDTEVERGLPYLAWFYQHDKFLEKVSVAGVNAQIQAIFGRGQRAELVIATKAKVQ